MGDSSVTIPGLIERVVRAHPDRDSFVFHDVGQTYAELERSALDVARALTALGVRKGDRVGAVMPNCIEFVHVMLALERLESVRALGKIVVTP